MQLNKRLSVILFVLLVCFALPAGVTSQDVLDSNESLVMTWIERSFRQDVSEIAAPLFTSDFVYYDTSNGPALNYDDFVSLDFAQFDRVDMVTESIVVDECVVETEHDLAAATYVLNGIDFQGHFTTLHHTILFRIEDGQIAEAWLNHTLG